MDKTEAETSDKPKNLNALVAMAKLAMRALDPEMHRFIGAIRRVADYDIEPHQAASFLRFHSFITNPQPRYITAWRADPRTEIRWYGPHVNGILGDVRGALAAAHYHAERLEEIEAEVEAVLAASPLQQRMHPSQSMGFGGTRKLDIEYHAFVLACRRSLDYLATALACYFKLDPPSFRKLPKSIARGNVPSVVAALSTAHARHVASLDFILAEGRRSVRNRIAHYEFVSAGCINLNTRGFFLAGGGEELRPRGTPAPMALTTALASRLTCLHACVDDMIDTFVVAARTEDQKT